MSEISQYFSVIISSPEGSKGKQVYIDATNFIEDGVTMTDEDGLIKDCSFDMKEAYTMMNVLAIGMRVKLVGGDLINSELIFEGYIKGINPEFQSDGNVTLKVSAHSQEGGKLGIAVKDFVYPANKHFHDWATKNISYSGIIINLAKESKIRVQKENIYVQKDIMATRINAVRQRNMTDWAFMQFLAEKIHCTLWTTEDKGVSTIHLKDTSSLVNTISSEATFFFLVRISRNEFKEFTRTSEKQIQLIEAQVNLDTRNAGGLGIKQLQGTDKDGNPVTKMAVEKEDKNGKMGLWVLDDIKVAGLSEQERTDLMDMFMSGKVTWDGDNGGVAARNYFKYEKAIEASREGKSKKTVMKIAHGAIKKDGVGTQKEIKEKGVGESYTVDIHEDKLEKLSSEDRSAIMGRITRGEMTDQDKAYYTVKLDEKPTEDKKNSKGKTQSTKAGVEAKKPNAPHVTVDSDKDKRDAGFHITAKVYGNLKIKTKMSYVLEGLGKYSGDYYLYKITYEWGKNGFIMDLVFVK